eukprot:63459_1
MGSVRMNSCTLLILLFSLANETFSQMTRPLLIKISPNNYQNDIVWEVFKISANGSRMLLDSGSGIDNTLSTKLMSVSPTNCLLYNLTDTYGDGIDQDGGHIDVYYGWTSIDNAVPTETFDGKAYSDEYLSSGRGGQAGSVSYYIQNGVEPFGGCAFPDQKHIPGCQETTAVDIIFLLDTASDLSYECQHYYFSSIVDLMHNHIPRDDLRISILTFGTSGEFNPETIINMPLSQLLEQNELDFVPVDFSTNANWDQILK